jgi:hypothetical protein
MPDPITLPPWPEEIGSEPDDVRELYGRVEDLLDRAIGYLVERNLYQVRRMVVKVFAELNSRELV